MNSFKPFTRRFLLGFAVSILATIQTVSAADHEASADKQRKLIAILQSAAPPQEKAIACKQLAIYGDKAAAPSLAPLLLDKDLASWARIALEAIPGPEADEALRGALPKLQGKLLIGAINSIGVRRDSKAVDALAGKLTDADAGVVAAAAVTLGKIGGTEPAKILREALVNSRKEIVAAAAEGGVLCAEHFLAEGKFAEATQLYDAVRAADAPKQRRLEATRGAILARQSTGIPLLLEELRSADKAEFQLALRTARELPGVATTEALGAELDRTTPDRQPMLLLALADRGDASVLPKLLQVARQSSKPTRIATLGLLDRFSDPATVPILLDAASEDDEPIARTAKATLTRMEGQRVDAALLSRLPQSSGKMRQAIIELAALRRMEAAVPAIVPSTSDENRDVRRAALATLSTLGSEQQTGDLVGLLLKTKNSEDREAIEQALTAICGRRGANCGPHVLPLAKNADADLRKIALHALGAMGGSDALAAVKAAIDDSDPAVQDEAVSTLATWPNNWPQDAGVAAPLLALAKSGKKVSHQMQGVRGYFLYLQENKKLSNAEKLSAVDELLPRLQRPQEKRLAIATLSGIPTERTLAALTALANDATVTEEACLGLVTVATAKTLENASKETCRKALQTVLDKSKNDSTRKKAADALKSIQ